MDAPFNYKSIRRRLCGFALLLSLLISFARFAVGRVDYIVLSDVLLADSLLASLLSLLQTLLILVGFALFYSFNTVLIHKLGFAKAHPFMFLAVGSALLRAALSLLGKLVF